MEQKISYAQLYLRAALGIPFVVLGLDRLGVWGAYGNANVSWGDWKHFSEYAHQVMQFLPYRVAEIFAVAATICEISFGALLIVGLFTRWVALGSALLTFCFAISMAVSFGITSPINYSVFAVSAASFLLSLLPSYKWSLDALFFAK